MTETSYADALALVPLKVSSDDLNIDNGCTADENFNGADVDQTSATNTLELTRFRRHCGFC